MDNHATKEEARKPYRKPEAKRFSLRPDEAVLGGCKSAAVAGPSGVRCNANVIYCRTAGS